MKVGQLRWVALLAPALALACAASSDDEFRGEEHETKGDEDGGEDEGEDAGEDAGEDGGDGEGCTLTQGYWKNHNVEGNASSDPWPIPEDTELCDQRWVDILWTPPKGDAWYILAHQYIAAELNVASGASTDAELDAALSDAEALLSGCSIAGEDRDEAIALSGLLDDYNNGLVGPGHCDDDDGGDDGGDDDGCDDHGTSTGGETDGGGDDDGDGEDEGGKDDGDPVGPVG